MGWTGIQTHGEVHWGQFWKESVLEISLGRDRGAVELFFSFMYGCV